MNAAYKSVRCAIGSAFNSSRRPELPTPLPDFFAKRAKALVELELDDPRVATVQALALLSCHEASMTRDTRSWLFSGKLLQIRDKTRVTFAELSKVWLYAWPLILACTLVLVDMWMMVL